MFFRNGTSRKRVIMIIFVSENRSVEILSYWVYSSTDFKRLYTLTYFLLVALFSFVAVSRKMSAKWQKGKLFLIFQVGLYLRVIFIQAILSLHIAPIFAKSIHSSVSQKASVISKVQLLSATLNSAKWMGIILSPKLLGWLVSAYSFYGRTVKTC